MDHGPEDAPPEDGLYAILQTTMTDLAGEKTAYLAGH